MPVRFTSHSKPFSYLKEKVIFDKIGNQRFRPTKFKHYIKPKDTGTYDIHIQH